VAPWRSWRTICTCVPSASRPDVLQVVEALGQRLRKKKQK
jgi:hypothetical protein